MKDELISIIIPVYNVEKYLGKCIESIINQTYNNLEIILVNDGSKDGSKDICEAYKKKDKRIIVVNKENGGLSDARNSGIKIAKGKYIGFVDSDDYIDKDMYKVLYNDIVSNEADIAICNYKKIYENDLINVEDKFNNTEIYNKVDAIRLLITGEKINDYAWNKLYKKELFENIKYPVGKNMEDMGTTYKLFEIAERITYNEYIGYYYLQRNNSILGSINKKFILDLYEMKYDKYSHLKEHYQQYTEILDINRLNYTKYYYMFMVDCEALDLLNVEKFKDEYKFYKLNYKKYRKKMEDNKKKKIENHILFLNLKLFIFLYRRLGYDKKLNTKSNKNENKKLYKKGK